MLLSDEALIQIRLSSDDLDGPTLQELADHLVIFLEMLLAFLHFMARASRLMLEAAKVVYIAVYLLLHPWLIWSLFWIEVANWALEQARLCRASG
jgi:hypothetical protein